MPSSKFLIASNTLTGTAASVTFSSIPATYADLVLQISARSDTTSANQLFIQVNGSSATNYSVTGVFANTTTAASGRTTSDTKAISYFSASTSNATASTFGTCEIYIPSYRVSQNKPFGSFGVRENNSATTAFGISANAMLWRDTSAITSINITPETSNFVSGSTFWLYGLKSS